VGVIRKPTADLMLGVEDRGSIGNGKKNGKRI